MIEPPDVFKCAKMTEQKKKQKKKKDQKKQLTSSSFTASFAAAGLFIHASRNSDIGPMKNILNVKQINYLDGICKYRKL